MSSSGFDSKLFEKVGALYLVDIGFIIDPNLHNSINDCFKACLEDFQKIIEMLKGQGKDVSRLRSLVDEYSKMLENLRYVKTGMDVLSSDVNFWMDLCRKLLEIDKEIARLI